MKKIIIIVCVLILAGTGCTKTKKNTKQPQAAIEQTPQSEEKKEKQIETRAVESNLSAEEISEMEKILKTKSAEVGFKIYYPTFIPNKLKIDEKTININAIGRSKKIITYTLSDNTTSSDNWIAIQEQNDNTTLDQELINKGGAKYFNGYISTIKNDAGEFNVLIILKEDKTFIRMVVKKEFIDADTLSKIAESMK